MPSKIKRASAAKPAVRRKAVRKAKTVPEISIEEVVSLELQAARHSRSESTWLSMTAAPASKDEDHWNGIEDHLLAKGRQEQDSDRRWKYFAK